MGIVRIAVILRPRHHAERRGARPEGLSSLCEGMIMRPLSLLLPASLLVLAASASAQNLPYPQADSVPASTVQVTAPIKPVLLFADEAERVAGSYAMSNGWRMQV